MRIFYAVKFKNRELKPTKRKEGQSIRRSDVNRKMQKVVHA
jgi:hypothetical protein